MTITEILELIVEYVAIWAPSLVAILGTITTVLLALNKCKDAILEWKNDQTLKDVKDKLTIISQENEELVRCNKLLLEELTKIQGYADAKKREE